MSGISTPRAEPMKLSARIRAAEIRMRRQQIEAAGFAEQLRLSEAIGGMHQQRAQQASDKAAADLAATVAELEALQREQLIRVQQDTQQPISEELQDVIDCAVTLGRDLESAGDLIANIIADANALTVASVRLTTESIGARDTIKGAITDALLRTVVRPMKDWGIGPQPMDRDQVPRAPEALRRAAASLGHYPPRKAVRKA
jgi:hypothetical protein